MIHGVFRKTEGEISPFHLLSPFSVGKTVREGELTGGEGEEVEGHVCQGDDGQHAVVSIGLNEIMTGDGCGVDVVLSERTYEGLRVGAESSGKKHSFD